MTRVIAALVAIAMLVGAFQLRADRAAGLTDGDAGGAGAGGELGALCDAELAAACEALRAEGLAVTVETAGASFERLTRVGDGAIAPQLWLTLAPWPDMVDEARARGGLQPLFAGDALHVASSPLVIVTWTDRGAVLASACDGVISWSCAAGRSGQPWADLGGSAAWGSVRPGFSNPTTSSVGLSVLAAATAEELGTVGFGSRSLGDGPYLDWLTTLVRGVPDFDPSIGSPLAAVASFGPSSYDLVGTTEAAARAGIATNVRYGPDLDVHYPTDVVADVVLAGPAASDTVRAERTDTVARSLAAAGWHTAEQRPEVADPAAVVPTVDDEPGASLPTSGAMTALRTTFAETARR